MPRLVRILVGIFGLLIFIGVVSLFLSYRLLKKSLPKTSGSIKVEGLAAPIEIYRDEWGVPHIFAGDESDLYFAIGFVHAQDRLWQMDLNRRAATGKLSEIFGSETLEIDKFIRTIQLPEIANDIQKNLSPKSLKILQSYTRGINYFLEHHQTQLPVEFTILRYQPQPWKIEHTLAYHRLVAWALEMGWYVDPAFGLLAEKVPLKKLNDILPDRIDDDQFSQVHLPVELETLYSGILKMGDRLQNITGLPVSGLGSNSWVVSGKLTKSGKPLLANDPHLIHQNPALWYEIHIVAPDINCSGVSMPGLPGIIIGNNQAIAWGLTNVMADGCDLFIEKINAEDSLKYLYNGQWQQLTIVTDTIQVKDHLPVILKIRRTHHGPIISDIDSVLQKLPHALSVQWTGRWTGDEVMAFHFIMQARSWPEFVAALENFSSPSQNYIYADTAGNIGYYAAGKVPIRKAGYGILPRPGWVTTYEWEGWIPFSQLPHFFNPEKNLIVTANHKIIDDRYPYYISSYWEPSYRYKRIFERLTEKEKFSVNDFQEIQSDQFSSHAAFLMPVILKVLPALDQSTKLRQYFVHSLEDWNRNMDVESVGATIFEVFLRNLFKNIFVDEMGETLFRRFVILPNIPIRITDHLFRKGKSLWFDDVTTPQKVETRDEIVLITLEQTFREMRNSFGDVVYDWRWGNVHTIEFKHILGRVKPLSCFFNIGPFPIGGSGTTVNLAGYSIQEQNFAVNVGPSMRQIIDLANIDHPLRVIPTGQSGHPLSKHYKDQTPLWLKSRLHQLVMDSRSVKNADFDLLKLQPSN